ncbi:MAG: hypothetical protein ACXVI1_12465 [Halobacteriota archaeon]
MASFVTFLRPATYLKHSKETVSKSSFACKLAEAKQIPHTIKVFPVHFWVDCSCKVCTNFTEQYETTQVAFNENGQFKPPGETNASLYLTAYKDVIRTSMPLLRKIALIAGFILIIQLGHFKGSKNRWQDYVGRLLDIDSYFIVRLW